MVITHKSIQIEYKGHLLNGEYSYSAKDLNVRLKTPHGDLRKGEHIQYMVPKQWSDEHADTRAKEIIVEIGNFYCSVLEHEEEIINVLASIEEKKAVLEEERSNEKQEMQRLKRLLKEGTISTVEYQKNYTPHKKRCNDIEIKQGVLFRDAILVILKDDFVYIYNLEYVIKTIVNK